MSGHHHDHDHHHVPPASYGRAFVIGIVLNLGYVIIEAIAGAASGSMALVADAGHNLSDVLGLALAFGALRLSARAASARFTYGLKRSGILAALANGVVLFVACGAIAVEAVQRLAQPQPVPGVMVMIVAGAGILVNGLTAWLFAKGRHDDVNIRGAYLHMLADAGISAAVVASGFLILKTGQNWIDPALSLIVVAVIVRSTWGLLRESVTLALDGVPPGIDAAAVADFLKNRPGVTTVHDLHIWPMGTNDTALTAHLVMPAGHDDAVLAGLAHDLEHQFGIGHATIQVETGAADCAAVACA